MKIRKVGFFSFWLIAVIIFSFSLDWFLTVIDISSSGLTISLTERARRPPLVGLQRFLLVRSRGRPIFLPHEECVARIHRMALRDA